ncbi:MAG: hypothetical protein V4649_14525 [Bacteroidota bacterium]
MQTFTKLLLPAALMLLPAAAATAQVSVYSQDRHGSIYLSIGTSMPSYKASTIHIKQGALGNDFELQNVTADDESNKSSSILSSNFRVGYFFSYEQDWGVELNYDPISYHVTDGQTVPLKGMLAGAVVDKTVLFSKSNGYSYYLNGANLVLVNVVKRFGIYKNKMHTFYLDALVKAGVGPVMPSISNNIDGKATTNPSFQVSGWNAGVEPAVRATIYRHAYAEVAWKYDYASYSGLNVYSGTAKQKVTSMQFIFSLGYTFSTTKWNPRFNKVQKERKIMTIGSMNNGEVN